MMHQRTCQCEHHTNERGEPRRCGQTYTTFGHYGWGEPWIAASRCDACHGCGNGMLGLSALAPAKRRVGQWVASDAADATLGQHMHGMTRSSYGIRRRLSPRFVRARGLVREGARLDGPCGHMHLFEVEVPGHFVRGERGWEPSAVEDHHVEQQRYVLDVERLIREVSMQEPPCPLCGHALHLMMHEGWIRSAGVGFDDAPRPYRVFYLSCVPDWNMYTPNNPVAGNFNGEPFVQHPLGNIIGWSSRLSFWHPSLRSTPAPEWT